MSRHRASMPIARLPGACPAVGGCSLNYEHPPLVVAVTTSIEGWGVSSGPRDLLVRGDHGAINLKGPYACNPVIRRTPGRKGVLPALPHAGPARTAREINSFQPVDVLRGQVPLRLHPAGR